MSDWEIDVDRRAERERIRRLIQHGADELDRGDVVSAEDVFCKLDKKHARVCDENLRRETR